MSQCLHHFVRLQLASWRWSVKKESKAFLYDTDLGWFIVFVIIATLVNIAALTKQQEWKLLVQHGPETWVCRLTGRDELLYLGSKMTIRRSWIRNYAVVAAVHVAYQWVTILLRNFMLLTWTLGGSDSRVEDSKLPMSLPPAQEFDMKAVWRMKCTWVCSECKNNAA